MLSWLTCFCRPGGENGHLVVDLKNLRSITVNGQVSEPCTACSTQLICFLLPTASGYRRRRILGRCGRSAQRSRQSSGKWCLSFRVWRLILFESLIPSDWFCLSCYRGIGGHASYGGFGFFSRAWGMVVDQVSLQLQYDEIPEVLNLPDYNR